MTGWSWESFLDAFPYIFKGLHITLLLTIYAFLFSLVFGFFWFFMKRIQIRIIRWFVSWLMEFIRSTPPLIQLFFVYYSWPMVPIVGSKLSGFTTAVIVLGIHFSTYIGEVYRAGIEDVESGQWEAAKALNYTTLQKWTKIILPQAIPPTIPMLGNYLIILFKEVPLASTIGVLGILGLADEYSSQYFTSIEPYTIVALLFLLLSYPSSLFINYLERRFNTKFDKHLV